MPATKRPAPLPYPLLQQFVRYVGAGAIGTAAHYAVLIALVQLAHVGATAASTMGAIAGALVNYALNHRFIFASQKTHARALPRFATVAALGIALNAVVVATLLAVTDSHYLIAQVVATGAVVALGFLANRLWTF